MLYYFLSHCVFCITNQYKQIRSVTCICIYVYKCTCNYVFSSQCLLFKCRAVTLFSLSSAAPVVVLTLNAAVAGPKELLRQRTRPELFKSGEKKMEILKLKNKKSTYENVNYYIRSGWAAGPSDSLSGSCHWLKVTRCIYTLTTDTEGAGLDGCRHAVSHKFRSVIKVCFILALSCHVELPTLPTELL